MGAISKKEKLINYLNKLGYKEEKRLSQYRINDLCEIITKVYKKDLNVVFEECGINDSSKAQSVQESKLSALKLIFERLGKEFSQQELKNWRKNDYLTYEKGVSGERYLWYVDDDYNEVCVNVRTLKCLTPLQIKQELCSPKPRTDEDDD